MGGEYGGRQRLRWIDGVKMAFGGRGMLVEAARQCAKDKEWRVLVHMSMKSLPRPVLLISDRPPTLW